MIPATQIKVGQVIIYNNEPCRVVKTLHITPGNWRGMVQVKLVNVKTGTGYENRFRSEDKIDLADLEGHTLKYLYHAEDDYTFMSSETYELMNLSKDELGDTVNYLIEDSEVTALYYEGRPVSIELPNFVILTVTETEPTVRGATVSASPKPATMETGLQVRVPQFINQGDRIKIDTRDATFVERA
jgi:elongation factor P